MRTILSKLVTELSKPIVAIFLFLGLGVFWRKKKWGKRFLWISVVLFLLFTNPFFFGCVARFWEGKPPKIEEIERHDFLVLLGGFTQQGKQTGNRFFISERGNRLMGALELMNEGKADKLLISGGSGTLWKTETPEADYVANFLVRTGIPDSLIIRENQSVNTFENGLFTAKWLKENHPEASVILVTSAFHMPRAKRVFEKQGVKVSPFAVDHLQFDFDRPTHIFVPGAEYLKRWEVFIKEWIGITVYKLKGEI